MFDHVTMRAGDRAASERFYRASLGALSIEPTHTSEEVIEWQDLLIAAADAERPPTRRLHVAFVAASRERVEAFWRAGLSAGGSDDGEPGERPQYTASYYGAFVRDPDGNSAEAVIHDDARRGGHIDHLWIRVRDLLQATAFYSTVARHTGLRAGRQWDVGRQFRGAWATFSLVADGSPPTENLELSFPAPDRRTVEDFYEAATSAGYRGSGAPAQRAGRRHGCYSAYVLDPEGTIVESVFRARSG